MTRALAPAEIPVLPDGQEWRRSLRMGAMYHIHVALGSVLCGGIILDRNNSRAANSLGDFQFWGACPRCMGRLNRDH
jgi:hypothetical protein